MSFLICPYFNSSCSFFIFLFNSQPHSMNVSRNMSCIFPLAFFLFSESHSVVSEQPMYSIGVYTPICTILWPRGLYSPWNSPGQNTGVGNLSLLQRIFPTQGSSPGLLHCKRILYHLSHMGSPRILEWVAYPFSSGSSKPRNWTRVSCIAGIFFTNWAIREALPGSGGWF